MPGSSNRSTSQSRLSLASKPPKFDSMRTLPTSKRFIAVNVEPVFMSIGRDARSPTIKKDDKRQLDEHKSLLDVACEEQNFAEELCSSRLKEIQDMEMQLKKRTDAFIACQTALQAERQTRFNHNVAEYVCLNDEKDTLSEALATADITANQLKDVIRAHLDILRAIAKRHKPVQGSYEDAMIALGTWQVKVEQNEDAISENRGRVSEEEDGSDRGTSKRRRTESRQS